MKYLRLTAFLLALVVIFIISGCGGEINNTDDAENKFVIYYDDPALTKALTSLTKDRSFGGRNIEIKLTDGMMNTFDRESVAAYIADAKADLTEFYNKGYFSDLTGDSTLSELTSMIPNGIQLNATGIGNYGIPLMLEAYGYIVDTDMLKDLFGADSKSLLEDLRTCSYTDFEGFAAAVDTYISAPTASTVTVNGTDYTFNAEKSGKAANLTGVFAMNAKDNDAAKYLLSTVLNAKFRNRLDAIKATENDTSELKDLLGAYMDVLDLHSSYVAGVGGSIGRGDKLTGGDFDYTASVDAFTKGYALFYPGSTADAADFEKSSAGFGANLDIIPFKLPVTDGDITVGDLTAEKLQSSIIIGSRYYLSVNPKAAEGDIKLAKDLAKWLFSDEAGRKLYNETFGGVPFNYGYENTPGTDSGSQPETSIDENAGTQTGDTSENPSTDNSTSENLNSEARNAKKNNAGYNATASENLNSKARNERMNGTKSGETTLSAGANYDINSSLMASVARYYAEGNWLPAMVTALPNGFTEDILGDNLMNYWGKELWENQDRENFVDMIIGGWNEKMK